MNTPATGYRETFAEFFLDRFKESEPYSTWCLGSFLIAIGIAVWIVVRRKRLACRLALGPFSFVPFMIATMGFAYETAVIFNTSGHGATGMDHFNTNHFLNYYADYILILPFGILLSTVLLILTSILLFAAPSDDRKP